MRKLTSTRLLTALATGLFLLLAGAALQAEPVSLVGELVQDDDGNYLLVEESSGDSIALKASIELPATALEDHAGTMVEVTGEWSETEDSRYFIVSKIQPSSSS
ncbi:MAG TPA: hypothetical protein VMV46_04990 [Thermoanaerobaculia bacterium]|nr:hypothetical protein [Thermoanaerobaculia bacterium]